MRRKEPLQHSLLTWDTQTFFEAETVSIFRHLSIRSITTDERRRPYAGRQSHTAAERPNWHELDHGRQRLNQRKSGASEEAAEWPLFRVAIALLYRPIEAALLLSKPNCFVHFFVRCRASPAPRRASLHVRRKGGGLLFSCLFRSPLASFALDSRIYFMHYRMESGRFRTQILFPKSRLFFLCSLRPLHEILLPGAVA
jgi:hypothetical protein